MGFIQKPLRVQYVLLQAQLHQQQILTGARMLNIIKIAFLQDPGSKQRSLNRVREVKQKLRIFRISTESLKPTGNVQIQILRPQRI